MNDSSARPSVAPSDPSWWFADALKQERGQPDAPRLVGEIAADVAIVGGGFTGMWTALALKRRRPGLAVALIEASLCGSGASGKNGGLMHGYWSALAGLTDLLGADGALAVARAGAMAQDGLRAFARTADRDVWLRDGGQLRVSTTPAQDARAKSMAEAACRLGVPDMARLLAPGELPQGFRPPLFRSAVFLSEGGTVHPGRLARALRRAVVDAGVQLYENTPMTGLDKGSPNRVRTAAGQIVAREVVLATNAGLATNVHIKPYVTVFSSFALMTEPMPEKLERMGWESDTGVSDLRMFVHYFRKTQDGRVLVGTGGGPLSYNGSSTATQLREDKPTVMRVEAGMKRLLPALADTPVAKAWGGPIDISSDRFPFFKTFPGTRIHYACGFSGHGVNPTYIAGQCLASLVLGERDMWSSLPLCTRELPRLPPEPFRFLGGHAIRRAIISCEDAEDRGARGSVAARGISMLPRLFGLRIGTR
ncbi:FAD-dependent oxidoreductase [Mesorhizobium sp. SP-1A]|uniref:NAD(P)/FAD-dependent oxidoreductase n=1 Tax=Mesorhizobium sp. SP-1A TaxID=3077840 RepID=UPI0028F6E64E|nr:FAD-dependent oxidoreductase [Mesorhizobium sp. SP-1A]